MTDLRTAEPRLRGFIEAAALQVRLPFLSYRMESYTPGELLEGWILAESRGDSHARRYELHLDRATRVGLAPDPDTAGQDDGDLEDDASYGLLQILGSNARAMVGARPGTPLNFGFLFRPMANLAVALRFFFEECLQPVYRLHPHEDEQERLIRALCWYNGGPTGDAIINDDFRLRAYVDRVADHCRLVRTSRMGPYTARPS